MGEYTLKEKFGKDIKPTICQCGGILSYRNRGEYICDSCGKITLDDFGKIYRFLDVNGPSPAVVISENTGVPVARINEFLREGRIEIPEGSSTYITCQSCGTEIRFGRFCQDCALKLSKDLSGAFAVTGDQPKRKGNEGNMWFLGRDKKRY